MPRKLGRPRLHDETPPENESHVPGASRNLSKKDATAIVRIARNRPDKRSAGIPTSTPTPIEQTTPSASAGQKFQPCPLTSEPTVNAPIEANEYWQKETCPTKPVRTTSDRTMSPTISDHAARYWS